MGNATETLTYEWVDNWAKIPDSPSGRENGRTHGVCVASSGNIFIFHQAEDGLLEFDPEGQLVSSSGGDRWLGAHGLTVSKENGEDALWLTDQATAEVSKVTLKGETIQSIQRPDHPVYAGDEPSKYEPTWATQNPDNGDVWVADGYGASLVHHYNKAGDYQGSLDGTEGAGRFACPHGLDFTTGANGLELFITDRANCRVVVYDAAGNFLRRSPSTHSPCCFSFWDGKVLVPELFTGVKVLDASSLDCLAEVGVDEYMIFKPAGTWPPADTPEGWPNLAGTEYVKAGQFNSPHAGCFAPNGDIYVVEWIIGGRITKLKKN